MKALKRIFGLLLIIFSTAILASCSDVNISTSVNVVARNNKITLVATFVDEEEGMFTNYTPYAYLYEMDGNEVGDLLKTSSFGQDSDLSEGTTFITSELVFDDLEEETSYTLRITITVDGESETLYDQVVSTNDYGTEDNPIKINNTDEFLDIANDREAYYILENDLDFEEEEISALFTSTTRRFEGSFDGNNHKISNFSISVNNQYNGLFSVNNGTIKNLTLENASIKTERTSEMNVGLLVGYNTGIIDNCHVVNGSVTANSTAYTLTYNQNVGGLVGSCAGTKEDIAITNCTLENTTVTVAARHQANIGGLVGLISLSNSIRGVQTIENNIADVDITVNQEIRASISDAVEINVGGFAGSASSFITNCVSEGTITVKATKATSATYENGLTDYEVNVAGFVAKTSVNDNRHYENIAFNGSIDVDLTPVYTARVAGLVAELGNRVKIENGLARLSELKIVGPKQAASDDTADTTTDTTTDEEAEGPTYTVTYGVLLATSVEDTLLTTNNIIAIIDTTLTIDSDYTTIISSNNSTDLTAFSEFINSYINSLN